MDLDNLHRICLQVYLCEGAAPDYSVSCYVLDKQTGQWTKLFTTGMFYRVGQIFYQCTIIADPNMDKVLMLSLSQDERYTYVEAFCDFYYIHF